MATSAADVSNSSLETISDEERRWMVVGICLTKVLTPALRVLLADKMPEWYESLRQSPYEIDKQTSTKHLKKPPHSKFNFNYKSINNNSSKDKACYDYAVKDPISLAMLFLQPHMAKCNGFDESMDTSAVLTIVAQAQPFVEVSGIAKTIRDVRNEWAHCNFSHWTDANYQAALEIMKDLIGKIGLDEDKKTKILSDLDQWKQKGVKLGFNEFTKEICDLYEIVKLWKEEVQDDHKKILHVLETMQRAYSQRQEDLEKKVDQLIISMATPAADVDQLIISKKNNEEPNNTCNHGDGSCTVDGQDKTDDDGQSNTATSTGPILDTTHLSSREITRLSLGIVAGWRDIAGLANLDRNEIENVNCDNISCPQPKDKAARILSLINNRSDFSRRKIGNILEEAGISALVDDVLKRTLR